jgi:hypothetical protein
MIAMVLIVAKERRSELLYILLLPYVHLRVDLLYHQWPRNDVAGGGLRGLLSAIPLGRLYCIEYNRWSFDCPIHLLSTWAIIGPVMSSAGTGYSVYG